MICPFRWWTQFTANLLAPYATALAVITDRAFNDPR